MLQRSVRRRKLCVKQVRRVSHVSQASLEKLTGLTLERSNFTNILRRLAEKWPELILDAFETVSIANKGSFQLREGDFTTGISHCGRSKLWQHACGLLDIMPRVHLRPSVIPFSATISACEKGGQWQQSLGLFEAMQTSRVHPDTISYNASISACEKAGEWQKALKLFVKMQEEGVSRDVYSFSATVSACEKGGQWQQALSLFEAMFVGKVCPNVVSYSAAISACEKSGRWQEALDLFERMPCANISPNVVSHSAVIGACEKGGQWQQALKLFEAMPRAKVSPNAISYSAAICACRQGSQWQQALSLFVAMPSARLSPNIISYNAAISACEKGGRWQQALNLFESMPLAQIEPDSATYNEILDCTHIHAEQLAAQIFQQGLPSLLGRAPSVSAQHIDLHGLSEGAARLMLRWWLSTLVAPRLTHGTNGTRCIVITGYGKSRQSWRQSDLRAAALELLQSLKLRAEVLPNQGRIGLVLGKEDLPQLQNAGKLFDPTKYTKELLKPFLLNVDRTSRKR